MVEQKPVYKIFESDEGDWFVVGKKEGTKVNVLYEGHSLEEAYEAILTEAGIIVPVEEKSMKRGTYKPKKIDFEK